jgi:hypothetical protein
LPTKTLYAFLFSCKSAICPSILILLNLITQIICGEQFKFWSSSLCSYCQTLVTSFIFDLCSSPQC